MSAKTEFLSHRRNDLGASRSLALKARHCVTLGGETPPLLSEATRAGQIVEGASRSLPSHSDSMQLPAHVGGGTPPLLAGRLATLGGRDVPPAASFSPSSPLESLIAEAFPDFNGFRPFDPVRVTQNRVPHWQQDSAFYFVTFRLGDSLPSELLRRWRQEREAWLLQNPKPWPQDVEREYHQRFVVRMEHWLDEGHGECLLRQPENARLVGDALAFFERLRVRQVAWVVMPNHVHALFALCAGWSLEKLLHSWKSYTSHELNNRLTRSGELWQEDYYNRIVRDLEHFKNLVRYIRRNPSRLREGEYLLWESEVAKAIV